MQNIELKVSGPFVVAQAPSELNRKGDGWGRWQFPLLRRLSDGRLLAGFSIGPDSASNYGKPIGLAYSTDEGRTWCVAPPQIANEVMDNLLLPNGDRLLSMQLPARRAEDFSLPKSVCDYVCSFGYPTSLYWTEDMPRELVKWRFRRLPADQSAWVEETAEMRIPNELCVVIHEEARDATSGIGSIKQVRQGWLCIPGLYGLWGKMRIAPDGSLWAVTYNHRLQAGRPLYAPLFLCSLDQGHTWDLLGEIPYIGDPDADPSFAKRDGFTEPDYNFRPDGSVICLMRTSDGNGHGPLYLTRSKDHARTWSKPVAFDRSFDGGKMPQLLTLDNGVTLASYGQSGGPGYIAVRATTDPAGLNWQPPFHIQLSPQTPDAWNSCGHTEMVALDHERALIVYSDFNYPDAEGRGRKTILVCVIDTGTGSI